MGQDVLSNRDRAEAIAWRIINVCHYFNGKEIDDALLKEDELKLYKNYISHGRSIVRDGPPGYKYHFQELVKFYLRGQL